jgi:hypothetical protein
LQGWCAQQRAHQLREAVIEKGVLTCEDFEPPRG